MPLTKPHSGEACASFVVEPDNITGFDAQSLRSVRMQDAKVRGPEFFTLVQILPA